MPAALRSSGLTADNMAASQDGYDPAAASPMPTTKPLLDKPTTPTSRTSLEKKMLQIVHQELQPVQAHIARLQEQLLRAQEVQIPALLERIANFEAHLAARRPDDFFTTAEVTSFSFDLSPPEIPMWLAIFFLPAVLNKYPLAHEIVTMDDATWASVKHRQEYRTATSWLARAVKAALLRDQPH